MLRSRGEFMNCILEVYSYHGEDELDGLLSFCLKEKFDDNSEIEVGNFSVDDSGIVTGGVNPEHPHPFNARREILEQGLKYIVGSNLPGNEILIFNGWGTIEVNPNLIYNACPERWERAHKLIKKKKLSVQKVKEDFKVMQKSL